MGNKTTTASWRLTADEEQPRIEAGRQVPSGLGLQPLRVQRLQYSPDVPPGLRDPKSHRFPINMNSAELMCSSPVLRGASCRPRIPSACEVL